MHIPNLKMNSALIYADLTQKMAECIDRLADQYYREVTAAMRTEAGRNDVTVEKLDEADKGLLVRRIIGGAHAVMDSFGTGSLMQADNPALDAYMNSDMWNPERPKVAGAPVTGRPEGYYTDIFGEQQYSSGRLAGVPLEGFLDSPIKAQSPSGAFQDSWKWLIASDSAKEAIQATMNEFWASVRANSGRYFKFG